MTRRALVLQLLRQAGDSGVTTAELLRAGCGSRYGARLLELRKAGFVITSERVREGQWRYRLTHDAGTAGEATTANEQGPDPDPTVDSSSPPALFELPPAGPASAIHDEAA